MDWTIDDLRAQEWAEAEQARLRRVRKARAAEIETVCAWCVPHKHLSGPVGAPPERVSHGICPTCAEKFDEEMTA